MDTLNVVFFVNSLDSGGLENYLLRFLKNKHEKFNRVYVYCKSGNGGQLEEYYNKLSNVEIIKEKLGFLDIFSYKKLGVFFKKNKVNIVCDFTGDFSGRVLNTARKYGVTNRVASYRSSQNFYKNSLIKTSYNLWVRSLVYKNSTYIVSNSKTALDFFYPQKWKIDKRFRVIYNGIDAQHFTNASSNLRKKFNISDEAYIVGHTGRFTPAKNHKCIVDVAENLIKKYNDIYFLLSGNGVAESLTPILKQKGLEKQFLVFENRSDIPEFLNTMDCYLFPSFTEGQPNALIEAMLVGIPCIASNIASIRETVDDFSDLYDPNDVEGFVAAIENLYKKNHGIRFRRNTKQVIDKFDAEVLFAQFYNVLVEKIS